ADLARHYPSGGYRFLFFPKVQRSQTMPPGTVCSVRGLGVTMQPDAGRHYMISFTALMTAPADYRNFDPAIGLQWPVASDSRLIGTRVQLTPFSALSGAVGATRVGTCQQYYLGDMDWLGRVLI